MQYNDLLLLVIGLFIIESIYTTYLHIKINEIKTVYDRMIKQCDTVLRASDNIDRLNDELQTTVQDMQDYLENILKEQYK